MIGFWVLKIHGKTILGLLGRGQYGLHIGNSVLPLNLLGCESGVIAQWTMLENAFILRKYTLKYHGAKSYFAIVQQENIQRDKQI